jgi:hypothetical protein
LLLLLLLLLLTDAMEQPEQQGLPLPPAGVSALPACSEAAAP